MEKNLMTRLSVCSLGVSCNEMIDTPMLLVVGCECLPSLHEYPASTNHAVNITK